MTHGSSNTPPTYDLDLPMRRVTWASVHWICLVCGGAEEIAPEEEAPTPPICPICHQLAVAEAVATLWAVRR
ncbi:hypothetical protein [Nonomuraea rhizosphaerae]|uniref:hypothetical protein n=1 Tax=Nonomuraea rhizosphaerae TaxID=2665663 RepID=UPI001C5F0E99|nr:hypothetical protein [Nonomuraea rhizosphaerae]